eukprot:COSAG02_NODE_3935_length_6022_cov_102.607294_1_plen_102_part_10
MPEPEPEPEPEPVRGTQGNDDGDEGPHYRARDMYDYGNEPGLLRRAGRVAYKRGSKTVAEIRDKSKAELIMRILHAISQQSSMGLLGSPRSPNPLIKTRSPR